MSDSFPAAGDKRPQGRPAPSPKVGSRGAAAHEGFESVIEQRLAQTRLQVRLVDLLSSLMLLAVLTVGYFFLAILMDHWLLRGGLGATGRGFLFAGLVLLWGVAVFYRVIPSLFYRINPLYAAKTLEHSAPSIRNGLINWLLLRQGRPLKQRGVVERRVLEGLGQSTAAQLRSVSPETAVDRSYLIRLGVVLVALVAVVCLYTVVSPKSPFISVGRILWPWAAIERPTRVTIEDVRPGDAKAFEGDTIEVSAEVRGVGAEEPVYCYFTTDDGRSVDQAIPMEIPPGGYRYQCTLPPGPEGFKQSLTYYVAADDGRSDAFRVTVRPPPTITVDSIEYNFPDYTNRPNEIVRDSGDIRGLEGTVVTIRASANVPIDKATLELDGNARLGNRMVVDGSKATTQLTLKLDPDDPSRPWHETYQIRFVDTDGNANRAPIRHYIEVVPDLPPEIGWVETPPPMTVLPLDGSMELNVRARDPDYALRQVRIRMLHGDAELAVEPLLESPLEGAFEGGIVFEPAAHRLEQGDQVVYWAEAADTKLPDANVVATDRLWITIAAPENSEQNRQEQSGDGQDQDQQRPGQQPEEGQPQEGQPQEGQPQEGQPQEGQPQEGQPQEGQPQEGQPQEGQPQEGQPQEGQPQEGQPQEGQPQEGQPQEGQPQEGQPQEGQPQEGQPQEGQPQEGQPQEGQPQEGQPQEGQPQEGQPQEGQPQEGQPQEGQPQDNSSQQTTGGTPQDGAEQGDGSIGGAETAPNGGGQSTSQGEATDTSQAPDGGTADRQGQPGGGQRTGSNNSSGDSGEQDGQPAGGGRQSPAESSEPAAGRERQPGPIDPQTNPGDAFEQVLQRMREEGKLPQDGELPKGSDPSEGGESGEPQDADAAPQDEATADVDDGADPREAVDGGQAESQRDPNAYETTDADPETTDADRPTEPLENVTRNPGDGTAAPGETPDAEAVGPRASDDPSDQGSRPDPDDPRGGQDVGDAGGRQTTEQGNGLGSEPTDDPSREDASRAQDSPDSGGEAAGEPGDAPGDPIDPSDGDPSGRPGPSQGGEGPGDQNVAPPRPTASGSEDPNLEYTKKATDLALRYLEDQVQRGEPDPELLDRLGWTPEQLEEFVDQWRGMQGRSGQPGTPDADGSTSYDEAVRSLGSLRPRGTRITGGGVPVDAQRSFESDDVRPPAALKDRFRAYSLGTAAGGGQ